MLKKNKDKHGNTIQHTIKEAISQDVINGNTYWFDAIAKEMRGVIELDAFRFVSGKTKFDPNDGWQKALLRIIFIVKAEQEDNHHRHKPRLVVEGH